MESPSRFASLWPSDPVAYAVWTGLIGSALCVPVASLRGVLVVLLVATTAGTAWLWHRDRLSTAHVLFGAILARLVFLPLEPSLTDDTFRYIWDGWVQWEGVNPYRYRPSDLPPETAAWLNDGDLFSRLNSQDFYSVYPPISQVVFGAGAWVDAVLAGPGDWRESYYTIKALFAAMEMGGLVLLATMISARRLVVYAWNPLVVLETAGQGHTEAALVLFLVLTVWAVRTDRAALAAAAITSATLVKLYPVVLAPLLLRRFHWRRLLPGAAAGLICIPYAAPYVIPNVLESLNLYVSWFEFFAGPYFALKHGIWAVVGADYGKMIGPVFRILFLGMLPLAYLVDTWKELSFRTTTLWILGGFLVFSTTVHPWYLLAVLPLAVIPGRRTRGTHDDPPTWGWVWLSAAALGTYTFYTGGPYWSWVVLGWTGAAVLAVWSLLGDLRLLDIPGEMRRALRSVQRRRSTQKAERIRPWLPRGARKRSLEDIAHAGEQPLRLLDLGSGEGFVGQALADASPMEVDVQLCDVVDMNATGLPHDLYDGRTLPYDDDAFDATVLYFVLHHCADPEAVLQEALRVTRGRVVIVESVVTGPIQRRLLQVADQLANRLRSGGAMNGQEEHVTFRRTDEWADAAAAVGGSVSHVRTWPGRIHPQALLIVEPAGREEEKASSARIR